MSFSFNNPTINGIKTKIAGLLFFLMLAFPYLFMGIKISLIGIIIIIFIITLISCRAHKLILSLKYIYWILLYLIMNSLYLFYAFIRGNPGINYIWPVYLLWPILYLIYSISIDETLLRNLFKVSYLAYISIIFIGLIVFFQINNFIPNFVNIETFGFISGVRPLFAFNAIQGGSIISFIFLFPFYLTMYITSEKFSKSIFNTVILILSFIFLFATSRRALILSVVYLPIIIFFFCRILKKSPRLQFVSHYGKRIFFVFGLPILLVLIFSMYLGLFKVTMLSDFIFSAFTDNLVQGASNERSSQAVALIQGWADSPIFGAGPGIDAAVSRSNIPGAYELSYLALLFSRGLFGFSIYFIQIIALIIWGIKLSNRSSEWTPYMISYNVAFVSFLISNAANPYLEAYDHLWVIFLFICLQNTISKINKSDDKNLYINTSV